VLPHTIVDDGLLDVCVIGGEQDPAEMLRLARTGAHVARPGVIYARGRHVVIERTEGAPVWFEHDGEVANDLGATFTFDVVPHGVPMRVGAVADRGRRAA
jgi:diacylglycerol kinase (ATP)